LTGVKPRLAAPKQRARGNARRIPHLRHARSVRLSKKHQPGCGIWLIQKRLERFHKNCGHPRQPEIRAEQQLRLTRRGGAALPRRRRTGHGDGVAQVMGTKPMLKSFFSMFFTGSAAMDCAVPKSNI